MCGKRRKWHEFFLYFLTNFVPLLHIVLWPAHRTFDIGGSAGKIWFSLCPQFLCFSCNIGGEDEVVGNKILILLMIRYNHPLTLTTMVQTNGSMEETESSGHSLIFRNARNQATAIFKLILLVESGVDWSEKTKVLNIKVTSLLQRVKRRHKIHHYLYENFHTKEFYKWTVVTSMYTWPSENRNS